MPSGAYSNTGASTGRAPRFDRFCYDPRHPENRGRLRADPEAAMDRHELDAGERVPMRALLARPGAAAVSPGIRRPTLVACGRQDAWSPLAQHEPIAAAIPGARLAVIEDGGHMRTVEATEAVTGLLLDRTRKQARA